MSVLNKIENMDPDMRSQIKSNPKLSLEMSEACSRNANNINITRPLVIGSLITAGAICATFSLPNQNMENLGSLSLAILDLAPAILGILLTFKNQTEKSKLLEQAKYWNECSRNNLKK